MFCQYFPYKNLAVNLNTNFKSTTKNNIYYFFLLVIITLAKDATAIPNVPITPTSPVFWLFAAVDLVAVLLVDVFTVLLTPLSFKLLIKS